MSAEKNQPTVSMANVIGKTLPFVFAGNFRSYVISDNKAVGVYLVFPINRSFKAIYQKEPPTGGTVEVVKDWVISAAIWGRILDVCKEFGYAPNHFDDAVVENDVLCSITVSFEDELNRSFKITFLPIHTGKITEPKSQLNYLDYCLTGREVVTREILFNAITQVQEAARIFNS